MHNMNGDGSTQHGRLFSLQAVRSNGKIVLSCAMAPKALVLNKIIPAT